MSEFGQIKYLNIRTIWPHEAHDFTPWLAENLDALGEVVGMDLELVEQEASVGDFSLDVLARDLSTGSNVVIENQFGDTNHDHLGKMLTYAAGFDAGKVIWISEKVRDEHRQALEWLNQRTDTDTQFFAIEIEVFQVDDSKPVYRFKPVVFPNEWRKSRRKKSQASAKGEAYRQYFQALIDELRTQHAFTKARVAQPQNWYSFPTGFSGLSYSMSFANGKRPRVELYIDLGDFDENKRLFDWLLAQREAIETDFGEPLTWERLDGRRAARIAVYRDGSIEEKAEEIRAWSIQKLLKMREVFGPRLKRYKKERKRGQP